MQESGFLFTFESRISHFSTTRFFEELSLETETFIGPQCFAARDQNQSEDP